MSVRITDYENLERACLFKDHKYRTVDIYVYNPEDDTYYRQWAKQRVRISKSGKTAWWMPYGTHSGKGGILIYPDPDLGRDAWIFNSRLVPAL